MLLCTQWFILMTKNRALLCGFLYIELIRIHKKSYSKGNEQCGTWIWKIKTGFKILFKV